MVELLNAAAANDTGSIAVVAAGSLDAYLRAMGAEPIESRSASDGADDEPRAIVLADEHGALVWERNRSSGVETTPLVASSTPGRFGCVSWTVDGEISFGLAADGEVLYADEVPDEDEILPRDLRTVADAVDAQTFDKWLPEAVKGLARYVRLTIDAHQIREATLYRLLPVLTTHHGDDAEQPTPSFVTADDIRAHSPNWRAGKISLGLELVCEITARAYDADAAARASAKDFAISAAMRTVGFDADPRLRDLADSLAQGRGVVLTPGEEKFIRKSLVVRPGGPPPPAYNAALAISYAAGGPSLRNTLDAIWEAAVTVWRVERKVPSDFVERIRTLLG
ncbi:MAG: hypothetical protein ACT4P1_00210 [Sporichthyaceae bacterium]